MFTNWIAYLPSLMCLLLGAGLVVTEVFLPGFGLPGVSGIVLIGVGVVLMWMNAGGIFAAAALLLTIAVLAVLVSWAMRKLSGGGVNAKIFLNDKEELPAQDMQVLVGKRGVAASVLRPAGIGDFDGVRLNVVTEGGFIERDMPIEIAYVDGARIVVRAAA